MVGLRPTKWLFGATVLASTLVAGGVALGAQLSGSATSVTGCLASNGDLTRVAVGDSPLKPCTGNQVQVHLTGDDVVSMLVAGTGLMRTDADGTVTLSLDPSYALPQGCAPGHAVVRSSSGTGWACGPLLVGPLP